jgi:hypothetical protein
MKIHEQKIIEFLNSATEPVDIEKIRKACEIGHWNTALNCCLRLLMDEKIKGQKTTKGWIFWTRQETHLKPWEEASGLYKTLEIREDTLEVTLTTIPKDLKLTYPKDSPEAQTLTEALKNTPTGTKIAILRTDDPSQPLRIRTLNVTPETHKTYSALRRSRSILLWTALNMVAFKFPLQQFELR